MKRPHPDRRFAPVDPPHASRGRDQEEPAYPPPVVSNQPGGGTMSKDKSILERFTDTVKDIANSASEALKADEPPKLEQSNAAYMPFAAEGLVSDPLLIPPVVVQPKRHKRTARKSSARKASARRAPKKARGAAKTS